MPDPHRETETRRVGQPQLSFGRLHLTIGYPSWLRSKQSLVIHLCFVPLHHSLLAKINTLIHKLVSSHHHQHNHSDSVLLAVTVLGIGVGT